MLTRIEHTASQPLALVRRHGTIRKEYSHHTQDSGNVSWLVDTDEGPVFIKTAGTDSPPPVGAPTPYFDHPGRVALLRNAVRLARSCNHETLPRLLNLIESPAGPLLVYEAVSGDLVGVPSSQRNDPKSAYQRFAHLPADELLDAFDRLIDLHRSLTEAGWVACDLYDGSLIYDFDDRKLHVVDLDSYRRGPSTNDMGRMFGSGRFMSPEEFQLGAPLDERTTVYTLGRIVWHFATRMTERADAFCGPGSLADVVARALEVDPADRWPSVAALAEAWESTR